MRAAGRVRREPRQRTVMSKVTVATQDRVDWVIFLPVGEQASSRYSQVIVVVPPALARST